MTKTERQRASQYFAILASIAEGPDFLFDDQIIKLVTKIVDDVRALRISGGYSDDFSPWYTQFVDATVSVAANYAEGQGKAAAYDKIRFTTIARGSAYEAAALAVIYGGEELISDSVGLCRSIDAYLKALITPLRLEEQNSLDTPL